jgi:hypothetical protein
MAKKPEAMLSTEHAKKTRSRKAIDTMLEMTGPIAE